MEQRDAKNEMLWIAVGAIVLAMTCLCISAVITIAVLGLPMFFFIQP